MKAAFILFLLTLSYQCSFISSVGTLRMELLSGKKKCIGQDFDKGDAATFLIGAFSSAMEGHLSVTV